MTRTKLAAGADVRGAYQSYREASDWRSITNDKEKYAAYLCSREWCEKREAVRERAGGKCERCGVLPMDACHHLTYERKYAERLEDLQAICTPCHEFTHGKGDDDPVEYKREINYLKLIGEHGKLPYSHDFIRDNSDAMAAEICVLSLLSTTEAMVHALRHDIADAIWQNAGRICEPFERDIFYFVAFRQRGKPVDEHRILEAMELFEV